MNDGCDALLELSLGQIRNNGRVHRIKQKVFRIVVQV